MGLKIIQGKTITIKLIFGYASSMLLATFLAIVIYSSITNTMQQKELYQKDLQYVDLFQKEFKDMMSETTLASDSIVLNSKVQGYLTAKTTNNVIQNKMDIISFFESMIERNNQIDSIHLLSLEKDSVHAERDLTINYDDILFLTTQNLAGMRESKGKVIWSIQKMKGMKPSKKSIVASRAIISSENFKQIGFLVVVLNEDVFQNTYKNFLFSDNYSFGVLAQNGAVIPIPEDGAFRNINHLKVSDWSQEDYHKLELNNKKMKTIAIPIENSGLTLLGAITSSPGSGQSLVFLLFFLVILNGLFIIFANILIKSTVVDPLQNIFKSARKITEEENLHLRFEIEENEGELNEVGIALNKMLDKVNDLVGELEEKHQVQKKLELDILASQIKPHFMYNTLNVASVLISLERKNDAVNLINSLGRFYRLSLNRGKEIVTLKEELNLLKDYIHIMEIRNGEMFTIDYDFDEEVMKGLIPKLTLQPLVENAFQHGIKDVDIPLHILCSGRVDHEKQRIILVVEDNGVGMPKETIAEIMQGKELERLSGFGIKNIIRRLMIYYGGEKIDDILKIESEAQQYTRFIFSFPLNMEDSN